MSIINVHKNVLKEIEIEGEEEEEININFLNEESEKEITKTRSVPIFGRKIDVLVLLMNTISLIIITILFFKLKLFSVEGKGVTMKLFYGLSVCYLVTEIINTKPEVTSPYIEHNMLVFQVENLLALFTPMVMILFATLYLLPKQNVKERYNIMIIIIILYTIAILIGHGETDNKNIRVIRLFKHTLFTIGGIFFLIYLSLLYTYKV